MDTTAADLLFGPLDEVEVEIEVEIEAAAVEGYYEEGEYVEEEEAHEDGWYDEDDDAEGVTDDWYA